MYKGTLLSLCGQISTPDPPFLSFPFSVQIKDGSVSVSDDPTFCSFHRRRQVYLFPTDCRRDSRFSQFLQHSTPPHPEGPPVCRFGSITSGTEDPL